MASRTTTDPIEILLEMGVDLDNLSEEEDYLSALMEAVNSLTIKDASDPRIGFLADEIRKVRQKRKEADPKFKAKKTKISANSFKSAPKLLTGKTTKISPQKLLPGSAEVGKEEEPEQDSIIKILTDISESVKSILYSLKASNNISKNLAEDERKRQESKKRSGAESKLEKKRFEGLKKLGGKLIQPIKGPLDVLFNFLKNVILGRVVIGIIDWLGEKENQEKLKSLGRFFKDWWPTIVTAVLLFGTGLGGLLKTIVGITFKFIPKLLGLLPGLLKFLKSPMGRVAGLAVAAAGLAGRMMDGGEDDVDLTKQDPAPAQTTPAKQTKEVKPEQTPEPMREGGMVPGKGPNKDTVPAMLAPGEFVMSRGAVQKYGADTMASMNAAGGGTNLPQRMNGITYAAGGGMMGDGVKEKISPKLSSEMKKRDRVVGRENLPPATIEVLERMDAQRAGDIKPSMQYTKDGRKISVKQFNRVQGIVGAAREGGAKGVLNHILSGAKNMFGGMFEKIQGAINNPKSFVESMGGTVVDSNSQEQNMKRVMALPPEMREAVLADMARSGKSQRILGEVKESSGVDVPGATADRQHALLNPDEYVVSAEAVPKVRYKTLRGVAALDQMVADADSNSTPAKLGMRSRKISQVGPPMPMQPQINLIPTPTGGSKGYGDSSGSALPNFDAGTGDSNKAKLLGVVR